MVPFVLTMSTVGNDTAERDMFRLAKDFGGNLGLEDHGNCKGSDQIVFTDFTYYMVYMTLRQFLSLKVDPIASTIRLEQTKQTFNIIQDLENRSERKRKKEQSYILVNKHKLFVS